MSFFKKIQPKDHEGNQSDNLAISSIIGKDMNIVGDITFTGKLRLDGQIKGSIKGEYLILGKPGQVTGDIEAETCTLQGTVNGNIKVRNMDVIKGCRIDGSVTAVNLCVESGAAINGEVKVDEKDLRLVKNDIPPKTENETVKTAKKAGNQ